jgi:hypothetical protein
MTQKRISKILFIVELFLLGLTLVLRFVAQKNDQVTVSQEKKVAKRIITDLGMGHAEGPVAPENSDQVLLKRVGQTTINSRNGGIPIMLANGVGEAAAEPESVQKVRVTIGKIVLKKIVKGRVDIIANATVEREDGVFSELFLFEEKDGFILHKSSIDIGSGTEVLQLAGDDPFRGEMIDYRVSVLFTSNPSGTPSETSVKKIFNVDVVNGAFEHSEVVEG